MTPRLNWERDGIRWPHRQHSRFVQAAGLRWHVQQFESALPDAPTALLLHGTGASTHSWRGLAPLLAPHFKVVSLDLPGHAFTDMPPGGSNSLQMSLPGMARAIGELLGVIEVSPTLMIGHSAGAAIAVRMALDGNAAPTIGYALGLWHWLEGRKEHACTAWDHVVSGTNWAAFGFIAAESELARGVCKASKKR